MSTVTELQRIAMRLQCGNAGKETPGEPRHMLWFGNSYKIHGRHDGFRQEVPSPHGFRRAREFASKKRVIAERRIQRQSPVLSREPS